MFTPFSLRNFCRKHFWLILNSILLFGISVVTVLLNPNAYRLFYDALPSKTSNKIYVITPTYPRPTRMADMTSLSNTLRLVPNIHWIVVEDADKLSKQVAELLRASGINYAYLAGPTPEEFKELKYGKGVASRRKAMEWLRDHARNGVLYFADDDNSYDIRVFEEMRDTIKASVWPVGLINDFGLSSPIVVNGKVIGFHDPYMENRVFAMDMAGFAVSIKIFRMFPNATMNYVISYLEDSFLLSLNLTLEDLEPKADDCTVILAWHTRTRQVPYPSLENIDFSDDSNLIQLYKNALYGLNESSYIP